MNSSNPILPTTSGAELSRLAMSYPQLWAQIQVHPNCPPEVAAWISQQRSSFAGGTPNPVAGTGWNGQNSAYPPYRVAAQPGAGAPQLAAAGRKSKAMMWLQVSIIGAAVFGLLSLLMPFVVIAGKSYTVFEVVDQASKMTGESAEATDIILLIVALMVVIAFAAVAAFTNKLWAQITSTAIALVTSLAVVFVTLHYRDQLVKISSFTSIFARNAFDIGAGLYILMFSGLIMVGLSIALIVLLVRERMKPTAYVMGQFS